MVAALLGVKYCKRGGEMPHYGLPWGECGNNFAGIMILAIKEYD